MQKSKTLNANADAMVLTTVGEAEGKKITAVGLAEANVIQKKTDAVGPGNYAMIESIKNLAASKIALVPQIVAGGGGSDGGSSGILSAFMGSMLKDIANKQATSDSK